MLPELKGMTLHDCIAALDAGVMTSTELCEAFFERSEKFERKIHAFISLDKDGIITQAKASDSRRSENKLLSPCDGIPMGIKDNIVVRGQGCSCASKILEPVKSPYDATVIERLRSKGVILFGRTNMDEFAMGSSCENSAFHITANPWDCERVPGGSSGGSAAAVAAAEVPASLGSDTGGSIRQPASFCGVVGLKPTYGRVSRYGLVAFASSLDQIGPISRNVRDAALILDMIGGHDPKDATSLPEPCGTFACSLKDESDLSGIKIGLPREYFEMEGLDKGVKDSVHKSVNIFKTLGAELIDISLPHTKYAVATYYVIATAEASANLARFDGVRYGLRFKDADNLMGTYFETRGRFFGEEVKRRILLGTFVLSSGYYDAYYLRAQKVRTLIRRDFVNAFEQCDVILTPVSPTPAFRIGEKADPLQMYLSDIYTIALNLAGICGISIPADIHKDTGLPVGIQLVGPALGERELLQISHTFELNRPVKEFIPPISEI